MSKTNEPFWWGLFSAGGMVAAFVAPVMILLTGFLSPLGSDVLGYEQARGLFANPIVKLALGAAVSLSLFHCVHRIRHTLVDLGVGSDKGPLAALCYGAAAAGSVWCAMLLAGL